MIGMCQGDLPREPNGWHGEHYPDIPPNNGSRSPRFPCPLRSFMQLSHPAKTYDEDTPIEQAHKRTN